MSVDDSGQYACEVENAVGVASSVATLSVLVPPVWSEEPPERLRLDSGAGRGIDCSASGSPRPLIFWRREGSKLDDRNDTRWSVLSNGTLVISDADVSDSGSVYCCAINEAGAILARMQLDVIAPPQTTLAPVELAQPELPHVIQVGPANQTLPVRSPALLNCSSYGDGNETLTISWSRNGSALAFDSGGGANSTARLTILASGSLRIEDLQPDDCGLYVCSAGDGVRKSSWAASLAVESPTNPNVAFNRAPADPLALPGSPSAPILINSTDSSLTLAWQSNSRMGASPLLGYTVEIHCPQGFQGSRWTWSRAEQPDQQQQQWSVIARRLKATNITINGIDSKGSLSILLRAENSHGLSLPSAVTTLRRNPPAAHNTPSPPINETMAKDLLQARELLSGSLLQLNRVDAVNSSAVQLHWDIVDGESYMEGLYLFHYKSWSKNATRIRSVVINDPGSMTFTLTQLAPNTNYTFFLVPFYASVEGRPSNSRVACTAEDGEDRYSFSI